MSRTMTRRRLLAGSVGAFGATVLAACGETQVVEVEKIVTQEVIKEVPVEKIVTQTQIKEVQVEKIVTQTQIKEVQVDRVVTQVVEKVVEAPPAARTVKFNFETDHTSGPRGKSTQWAIDRYNQIKPNTIVKFIAQPDQFTEKINIQAVAGTLSEISLLSDRVFQQWVDAGTWLQINDLLAKNPDFTPAEYHFSGEVYTDNKEPPGPLPYDDTMRGPQYGMPYQGAGIAAFIYNVDLLDAAGVPAPTDGWSYDDMLEGAMQVRDQETGVWGLNSGILGMQHQCWGFNGLQKYIVGPEGHLVLGNFQGAGRESLQRAYDYIHTYDVQFRSELRQEIGGEYGNPFNAGLQGFDHGRGRSTGFNLTRIGDRFRWAQAPKPRGPHPTSTGDNEYVDQPHIVASTATLTGTEEQVVDFAIFMAGPEVQGRNGIDRGFYPCRRGVQNNPAAVAPPPERMEELYLIYEKCLMRPGGIYVPGSPSGRGEVEGMWVRPVQKLFAGDLSVDETVEIAEKDVSDQMAKYKADLDAGRVSR